MAAPFDKNDDTVVVVIGTGAAVASLQMNLLKKA